METHPNISLVSYLSMRDLCMREKGVGSQDNLNIFHLTAKHSESVELPRILLQIDQSMAKEIASRSALDYLCERSASQFSTFNEMLECLTIAVQL